MKNTDFWGPTPCSLLEVIQRICVVHVAVAETNEKPEISVKEGKQSVRLKKVST